MDIRRTRGGHRITLDGWAISLVDRRGLPQLSHLTIRGVPAFTQRSVFEYAYQIGTEYIGGNHGHETLRELIVDDDRITRHTTLTHPGDGRIVGESEVVYRPDGTDLRVERRVVWQAEFDMRRAFVAMFPVGRLFTRGPDGPIVARQGRQQYTTSGAIELCSPLLGVCASLTVDDAAVNSWQRSAPDLMNVEARGTGRMVKIYAARSTGQNPEQIRPGDVHTAVATYGLRRTA